MIFDDWFIKPGAYVLVDGQYGSTGKGLLAAYIAERCGNRFNVVTTNQGPNSGHTAYCPPDNMGPETLAEYDEGKIILKQLPMAGVVARKLGEEPLIYLNGGAIIDPDTLSSELRAHGLGAKSQQKIAIHPAAAVIRSDHISLDQTTVDRIASTGKGIGPAMADKVLRNKAAVYAGEYYHPLMQPRDRDPDNFWDWKRDRVFVETAQGFSLGINTAKFYPYTTARECTVMQALSDARIPAQMLQKVVACYRTFPIRVGNTVGSSGDCYPDQREITWADVGVEPELTTVTKRVRRVFTWSRQQFIDSVAANMPDVIFLNFCNYLERDGGMTALLEWILEDYYAIMRKTPQILTGHGPRNHDIKEYVW